MSCPYEKELQNYLEENLSSEAMKKMEEHIDICLDCQRKLDNLLDSSLKLHQKTLEIDDEVLVEKIKAHRKGIRRITAYGILGFVLGLFSLNYTSDGFIVTKAIMALPYKLAEFMLSIFFSANKPYPWDLMQHSYLQRGMGFFPYHPTLGLVVEIITPALVAMFLALILGYLTSDKRVFQRKKILRFIASAAIIFILWFGGLYGFYRNTLSKIANLEDIKGVTIYQKQEDSSQWLTEIGKGKHYQEEYLDMVLQLSKAKYLEVPPSINYKEGLELWLHFKGGGHMIGHVDIDTGVLFMQNNRYYQLSEDTMAQLMKIVRRENNES